METHRAYFSNWLTPATLSCTRAPAVSWQHSKPTCGKQGHHMYPYCKFHLCLVQTPKQPWSGPYLPPQPASLHSSLCWALWQYSNHSGSLNNSAGSDLHDFTPAVPLPRAPFPPYTASYRCLVLKNGLSRVYSSSRKPPEPL